MQRLQLQKEIIILKIIIKFCGGCGHIKLKSTGHFYFPDRSLHMLRARHETRSDVKASLWQPGLTLSDHTLHKVGVV